MLDDAMISAIKADPRVRAVGTRKGGAPAYSARSLYEAYTRLERTADREPMSSVKFGHALRAQGAIKRSVWSSLRKQIVRGWSL
jgi:hypothetical protein